MKTLYITDLDGTLLDSQKKVSEYARTTLNALMAQGVHFSVATARTAASALKILSGLNISVPVVLMNGVVIYDIPSDKYLKTEVISAATAAEIIEILREHEISGFMYALSADRLTTYYENLDTKALRDFRDERVKNYYKSFEQVESFHDILSETDIIYFTFIDEYERLLPVLEGLKSCPDIDRELYRDIYDEHLWYLEIYSRKASKYNAVKYLREHLGFDRIIGFGDNLNDLPLLKACDEGYAVSNAVEELKEAADGVIGDNRSDSVVKFIRERESYRLQRAWDE